MICEYSDSFEILQKATGFFFFALFFFLIYKQNKEYEGAWYEWLFGFLGTVWISGYVVENARWVQRLTQMVFCVFILLLLVDSVVECL